MVSKYVDDGPVPNTYMNLMLLQVQQHIEYYICFIMKILFLQKRPREGKKMSGEIGAR